MRRPAAAIALLVLPLLLVPTATASAARPLAVGFVDDSFLSPDAGLRAARLDEVRAAEGGVVRLLVRWSQVAPPVRPAGFHETDSNAPGYRWDDVDGAVRDAAARRLRVILDVISAPRWAEGPRRPARATPGTWRPDAAALGRFLTAAATRYSGRHADPARPGGTLPRVRMWQVWNEPNLPEHLSPQWVRQGGRYRLESASVYRAMLNAAYGAIKAVRRDNLVIGAGTAPYGDRRAGGRRVMPVRFLRALLCLGGTSLRALPCRRPARLDAIAHHPYGVRGPRSRALNADDVAVPDVHKLTRVVRAAVRKRRVLPRRRKRVFVTEISWDSRPPDPDGVAAQTHARWLADSFFQLWRQGVDTVTWFGLRDQRPVPSYAETYQSGVLLASGRAKPAARAFRFPFVMSRSGRGAVAWGRSPVSGAVVIEERRGGGWRRRRALRVRRGGVFLVRLGAVRGSVFRARSGAERSLSWRFR